MFTQALRRIDGSVVVLKAKYMPIVKLFKKLLAVASLIPCVVVAQGYPNRPITVVVPYPPGGAVDPLARIFTTKLAEIWKVPIIIDNRPGAGTMIGMGYVAKAAPDGYTVAMGTTSVGTNPAMYEKMPFDTLKDFTFLSQAGIFQLALSVHPSIPVSTIAELIAYAKKNPGKLNYSSAGNGTIAHLAGEYFKSEAGFEATHVPYKGSSAAVTAVASAEVSYTIDTVFTETPMIKVSILARRLPARSPPSIRRSTCATGRWPPCCRSTVPTPASGWPMAARAPSRWPR